MSSKLVGKKEKQMATFFGEVLSLSSRATDVDADFEINEHTGWVGFRSAFCMPITFVKTAISFSFLVNLDFIYKPTYGKSWQFFFEKRQNERLMFYWGCNCEQW